jgi:hypothetical protein
MTPERFRTCRLATGLSPSDWARALGYSGPNVRKHAYDLETGRRPIPEPIGRLAEMYGRHGVPVDLRPGGRRKP